MTSTITITICILLLFAYIFDITSSKTKIPSVILLLVLGLIVRKFSILLNLKIPNLEPILPFIGTIGLILIVLEGSLELEINKSKILLILKSTIIAFIPILLLSFVLAYAFNFFGNIPLKIGLSNAIPFSIISSAIAIPSVKNLVSKNKEFITYESSISDIIGVIFFNFITLNDKIGLNTFGNFFTQIIIIMFITIICTILLAFLLSKIKHHVKFAPIIIMIILIYIISKVYHLPALIFILLFGLFIGNLDSLKANKFIQKLQPEILVKEVKKFKELIIEFVFLIRSLFFLLFGYLIQNDEILNSETMLWAGGICLVIFSLRFFLLKIFRLPIWPLFFIAPRGLITILLFLSLPISQKIDLSNKSLIIQVIILTTFIMMLGLMVHKNNNDKDEIDFEKLKDIYKV